MASALRRTVKVKPGGVIEIQSSELVPGTVAEVIVLVEAPVGQSEQEARVQKLGTLLKATQSLPQAQAITEEEISKEIAAHRARPR